jgi:hypothetical protein
MQIENLVSPEEQKAFNEYVDFCLDDVVIGQILLTMVEKSSVFTEPIVSENQ